MENLFIGAISEYLLKDNGKIDENKSDWLLGRLAADEKFDANEKALLAHIRSSAKEIHPKLKFKPEWLRI